MAGCIADTSRGCERGITVAAVAHTKRKPGYWLRRV
jgi:hypothetical protein